LQSIDLRLLIKKQGMNFEEPEKLSTVGKNGLGPGVVFTKRTIGLFNTVSHFAPKISLLRFVRSG
jgi:hypothetical protein